MTLHEAAKKALAGDPLGEAYRREAWSRESYILISENSYSMDEAKGDTFVPYVPCLADVLAEDWKHIRSYWKVEEPPTNAS